MANSGIVDADMDADVDVGHLRHVNNEVGHGTGS
jgi:hypothetical protein